MPKRTDIQSILIIGAGPIIIGQACEFDYSGTQAVKTLRAEGYRVILVNSNPATIMTDPEMADATYIEPVTPEFVEKIIAKERPHCTGGFALLPTMGGQTALNCAKALAESGVLKKYNVEMIGAKLESINKAEDRGLFNEAMQRIGLECPKHGIAHTMDEARKILEHTGLPAIIRPSFTMGGLGGGIAYNKEEFERIVASGLDASPTTEVLIDESVLGWKEYEMEVVRDRNDNCIIICSIENIDPMGVHTGDSITVAPALTLTDKEYQHMRNASIAVLREIGVDTGGSNVQFAVNPENGRMVVIEMNPRVSRSSALASKATGFPIAKVAAKLAVGYTLDEVVNDVVAGASRVASRESREDMRDSSHAIQATTIMPASFEPTIDYVVTKIPRFAFEKFPGTDTTLTTAMKSVGEAMAMGRNFKESLQKALRSLETGLTGLNEKPIPGFDGLRSADRISPERAGAPPHGEVSRPSRGQDEITDALRAAISTPTAERLLYVAQALRMGMSEADVHRYTRYDPWFIRQIQEIIAAENQVKEEGLPKEYYGLLELKQAGFSDARLAQLAGMETQEVKRTRERLGVLPVYKRVDTCAGEFAADTPYMYSTYEVSGFRLQASAGGASATTPLEGGTEWGAKLHSPPSIINCESNPTNRKKIIILGGGPNRIGQGIEFDYCCVHAAYALKGDSSEKRNKGIYGSASDPLEGERSGGEGSNATDSPPLYKKDSSGNVIPTKVGIQKKESLDSGLRRNDEEISLDSRLSTLNTSFETIMINCNPETVSTDYDTSDRLYFEPLTAEDVLEIIRKEQSNGELVGVIVQFGGQTPLKLAKALEDAGVPIIGTSPDSIDLAEDRERFQQLLETLKLKQPANRICRSVEEAIVKAEEIGYPVVIRPSYVLGGRAMAIIHDANALKSYATELVKSFGDGPILIDSYLQNAIEVDVDALSDGTDVHVVGLMEHVEEAGIHSGDSACSLPAYSLSAEIQDAIRTQTIALARALKVVGLMNVQFAVKQVASCKLQVAGGGESSLTTHNSQLATHDIYILEVNPRASRTVPFVAKATGVQIAKIAARIMAGAKLSGEGIGSSVDNAARRSPLAPSHVAVKEVVFPFSRFPGVDVILGPEMKSTGETMGLDADFPRAFAKAWIGAGNRLPMTGRVFVSVKESDKDAIAPVVKDLVALGFSVVATSGTAHFLRERGMEVSTVNKVREGRPHIVDMMKDGDIDMVFNTTEGKQSIADSFSIRRTALLQKIAYSTTLSGARAMVAAIRTLKSEGGLTVKSLQEYFLS